MKTNSRKTKANKRRFKAIVNKVRELHMKWNFEILSYDRLSFAIRCGDESTMDDRTVNDWILRLIKPQHSLWKDGPVLEPQLRIGKLKSGKVNMATVRKNQYDVVHEHHQARIETACKVAELVRK